MPLRPTSATWVRAQALWFRDRDDLLGRVLVVCEGARGLLALQAAAVNLAIVLPRSDNVIGVAAATIALLYWQLFLSWRMRRSQQRTLSTHLADLGVTCAIILTTAQVAPEASVLTLAGYWAGGCAAYAAVFRSMRWGVGFSLVTAAAMLVDPGGFVGERVGLAFAMVVLSAALALLIVEGVAINFWLLRRDAVSVVDYAAKGILPEALLNYLARLGASQKTVELHGVDETLGEPALRVLTETELAQLPGGRFA